MLRRSNQSFGAHWICHHRSLTDQQAALLMHQQDAVSINSIDLSHNRLSLDRADFNIYSFATEPAQSSTDFCSLCTLRLAHNQISELLIPNAIEKRFHHLTELDLSFNRIKSIPSELFAVMPNLCQLRLQGNEIESLDLSSLLHLKILIVGTEIGGNHLQHLDLSRNLNLNQVHAAHNQLVRLPLLDRSTAITTMILDHNFISSIDHCSVLPDTLQILSLCHNRVQSISRKCWPISLSILNLSFNPLSLLHPDSFIHLPSACRLLMPVSLSADMEDAVSLPVNSSHTPSTLLEVAAMNFCSRCPAAFEQEIMSKLPRTLRPYISSFTKQCAGCPMRMAKSFQQLRVSTSMRGHVNVNVVVDVCSPACASLGAAGDAAEHPTINH